MPLFSFRSVDNIDIYENSLHTRGENTKHEEKFLRKHICVYIYMRVYIYAYIYMQLELLRSLPYFTNSMGLG